MRGFPSPPPRKPWPSGLPASLACGATRRGPFDEPPPRKRPKQPAPESRSERDEPLRVEGKEHLGPERDRPRPERPEHGRAAQAGVDLQDPPVAGGEGRSHLRRGRSGGSARWVWIPEGPGL